MVQFQCMQQRRQAPPTLPSPPSNLSPQQLKRRHIVAAIVHSENSYVSTLQRLVNVRIEKRSDAASTMKNDGHFSHIDHRFNF